MSRTIVLTGVSRGLGRAMLAGFVEAGHIVIGCARSVDAVNQLQSEYGEPHRFSVVDVSDATSVATWAIEVAKLGIVPDLLINNAALMNDPQPLWEVPVEQFQSLMDVNVTGTFHVIKHFLPAMVERGEGVIVNFSSGWGRSTSADVAPYCCTKWAIEGLTQALASELPSGMAAIPLNPGVINTDMLQQSWGEAASHHPTADEWAKRSVPFILELGPDDNGQSLSVPNR